MTLIFIGGWGGLRRKNAKNCKKTYNKLQICFLVPNTHKNYLGVSNDQNVQVGAKKTAKKNPQHFSFAPNAPKKSLGVSKNAKKSAKTNRFILPQMPKNVI